MDWIFFEASWQNPWKDLLDGLKCIESHNDIVYMLEATKEEKTLVVLIDHNNFVGTLMVDLVHKKSMKSAVGEGSSLVQMASSLGAARNSIAEGRKGEEEPCNKFLNESNTR
jgi:hypothetical protein